MEHLSKSAIEKYITCGESYRRRYIVKEETYTSSNLVFGIAFHDAIEQYVKEMELGNLNFDIGAYWTKVYNAKLMDFPKILFDDGSPEESEELGLRLLDNPELFASLAAYKPSRMTWTDEEGEHEGPAIEMPITFDIPGIDVPFIGYIDMLCDDGVPMDFKTAARGWNADKAQKELQPAFYIAGLAAMGRSVPGNMFRHMVITKGKNPTVTVWETTRSEQEIAWAMRLAVLAYKGIEAGVFVPNPMSWLCSPSYCEFYATCMGGE